MTEMITVNESNHGIKTVNARDLHEFLGSNRQFANWITERIEKYGFVERVDFTVNKFVIGKATSKDYHISIDMAKQLSMVENSEKGQQARKYFIEVEKRYLTNTPKALTEDEIVLQALTIQTAKVKRLELENMTMKPKAESFDKFLSAVNSQSVGEVAKMLKIGRNIFFAMLKKDGILDKNNIPYQTHMKYFEVIDTPVKMKGSIVNVPVTKVKPEGIDYLSKKYGDWC